MNPNLAIKAENISKQYRLGEVGTGTLSHDLNRAWAKLRGKDDPFLKIGDSNDRSTKGDSDYVWSLKDINFEIEKGDAVGIIGRNGAGKSTLLKLLSRVTKPTTGHFEVQGRIASLLEVGTGFNPEMTGRENIFLNGAILGMRRYEIKKKFDEIVDFAGVERYIDTPVKRYSSGMYVRLAFAVAAHLESEILIVDEVLAVGDAEFQKKCLGKMGDVSKGEGRTVLFVSHNITSVKALCNKGIYLENGLVKYKGQIDRVIDQYTSLNELRSSKVINIDNKGVLVREVKCSNNGIDGNFNIEDDLQIEVSVQVLKEFKSLNINFFINTGEGSLIFATVSPILNIKKGEYQYLCVIPGGTLNDNLYTLNLMIVGEKIEILHDHKEIIYFHGHEQRRESEWLGKFPGLIRPQNLEWKISNIK